MVPVYADDTDSRAPQRNLAQLRCATAPPPLMEKMIPPPPARLARQHKPKPRVLCGVCGELIEDLGVGHSTRCAHCSRSVTVPSHVRVECERCGHGHHVRPRELATERLCAKCGAELVIGDLVLAPRRRHRVRRMRYQHHAPGGSAYADAAWAVLILGLTLVISILALTIL